MQIGQGITLLGFPHDAFNYTFNLAAAVTADDVGKPVAIDATADNTVKVAGDGDTIIGTLVTYENRTVEGAKVGAVDLKAPFRAGYTGTAPARGTAVVGSATSGKVKATATPPAVANLVVAVNATAQTVDVIFL